MGTFADFLQDTDSQSATTSSRIPEKLLDNLRRTESGKDDLAINKQTKAMGAYQFLPETVQMMHKQGIKFNPFDEKEARNAARTYLEILLDQNKGDLNKAVAQYGGFIKANPTDYVTKVTKGIDLNKPEVAANESAFHKFLTDEGTPAIEVTKPAETTMPSAGAGRGSYANYDVNAAKNGVYGNQTPMDLLKNQILAKQQQESPGAITGDVLQTVLSGIPAAFGGAITGKIAELRSPQFGTPQGAQVAEQQYQNFTNQFTHQPTTPTGAKILEYLGSIPEKLTGSSMGFGILPEAQVIASPATAVANRVVAPIAPIVSKVAQTAERIPNPFRQIGTEAELARTADLAAAKAPIAQANKVAAGSVGAKATEANPFAGEITGEERANRELFPAYKLSKSSEDAAKREQDIRAEVARTINPNGQVREGVITGNENKLRNEHQEAKNPERTPRGELLRQQIAEEQNALSNFAKKRIEVTGASPTLINDEQRGMRINDVFYGNNELGEEPTSLKGFLQQAKQTIYDDAKAKIGDKPVETNHIDKLFNNPQWKAGLKISKTADVAEGASELLKLAKEIGFEDDHGVMHPAGSVSAYDAVRKSLNSKWKHENASTIASINQAIDKDIAEVADPKLYKLGDRIHQAEKSIYDAEGLKKLFGETDQKGIVQSSTPLEKIPTKLNNLRKDQWRHVRDTLQDLSNGVVRGAPEGLPPVPESLRQSAKAALAEVDGALAREVYNAGGGRVGVWNQNDVNDVLNSVVGEKIAETFDPSEVKNYHVLNVGGHIMPGVHGYEGGAAQAQRIGLIAGNAGKLGAGAGGLVGSVFGPVGTAVGGYLGGKGGVALGERSFEKGLKKQATKTQKQMQKNANRPSILNLGENE